MSDAQLTYKVEIDVSGSAFGTAFAATDVTTKAVAGLGFEPITITWGRQDQFSSVNPTTVTGSLLNSDGLLSPGNASGTYYPRIRRGLRRRVSVTVATAGTAVLSEDYASSLEVVPAKDTPAVLNIEGADILARFGGTASTSDQSATILGTTMRSFLAEEMMLDLPTYLFMLQEASGATTFADVTGTGSPLVATASKYGAGVITAGQSVGGFTQGSMVAITNATYGTVTRGGSWLAGSVPLSAASYSIEAWVQMPSAAPASVSAAILNLGSQALLVTTSGNVILTGGGFSVTTSTSLCDGDVHQIAAVVTGAGASLYVDGALIGSNASIVPATLSAITLGMVDNGTGGSLPFTGAVAYAALYAWALSASNILNHYSAGATAFVGESTTARFARLLTYRPNPGSHRDVASLSTMGLQDIAGRSMQECLLEVGQVEAGAVFVDGIGQPNFRSRSRLFNPAAAATFSMTAGGVDFGSNWREDTQGVVNDVTITNSTTGSEQRFVSAASVALDGEFSTSVQLPVYADTDALNLAGWMVANGTQQQLTATPLIINLLHVTPAQAYAALTLAPLDVIQLTNCPTPAPSSTMTFVVQGGTISLGADAATATLNLTPYPYPVGVWDSTKWDAAGVTWSF